MRHHIRGHLDEDPEHYGRLSERLEEILTELGEQWEQLVLALGDLLTDARSGRQADESGLDPQTEAPFYDLLKREIRADLSPSREAVLKRVTVNLVHHIQGEITIVGFWHNAYAQEQLRRRLIRTLDEQRVDGEDLIKFDRLSALADRLVELAKANHARLIAPSAAAE